MSKHTTSRRLGAAAFAFEPLEGRALFSVTALAADSPEPAAATAKLAQYVADGNHMTGRSPANSTGGTYTITFGGSLVGYATPDSGHTGGMQVALGDGSVRFASSSGGSVADGTSTRAPPPRPPRGYSPSGTPVRWGKPQQIVVV